jgi:glycosyltransferase A (GT-A) superfamily protein (DUF2064 family)
MEWPDQHDVVAPGERVRTRATQALLVFADPVALDCQRRKWPTSFQRLFNTERLAGLAKDGTDAHIFTSVEPSASQSNPYTVHLQRHAGAGFGERLEDAVDNLATLGYDNIVIIGSDCPSLTANDIANAFRLLGQKRLVVGPDHRGGCYLIGLHASDRAMMAGIRWQQNTDCAELLRRFGERSTAQLQVKIDLDALEDLRLLARSKNAWSVLAAILLQSLDVIPCEAEESSHGSTAKHQTLSWQLPPPLRAIS